MGKSERMRTINIWGIIISIIGILDSGYLSWIKISHSVEKCIAGLGNCAAVNSSTYSEVYKIPVAYLGFLAYITIFLLFFLNHRIGFFKKSGNYFLFGITLIGFLFSIYLTVVQFAILKTFCPYCLLSAATTTILFILSITKLIKEKN